MVDRDNPHNPDEHLTPSQEKLVARLMFDLTELMREPPYESIINMSSDLMPPWALYTEQAVIENRILNVLAGAPRPFENTQRIENIRRSTLIQIDAGVDLHKSVAQLASDAGMDGDYFVTHTAEWPIDSLIAKTIERLNDACRSGLYDAENSKEELLDAAAAIRTLNLLRLFRPEPDAEITQALHRPVVEDRLMAQALGQQPIEPWGPRTRDESFYRDVYAHIPHDDGPVDETIVRQLEEMFINPGTRMGHIERALRRAPGQKIALLNRLCERRFFVMAEKQFRALSPEQRAESRRQHRRALRAMAGVDLEALHARFKSILDRIATADDEGEIAHNPDISEAARTEWTMFPPGDLQERADEIVSRAQRRGRKVTADKARLQVLENIREDFIRQHGQDLTEYAYGSLGTHRVIKTEEGEEVAEDYVVLIVPVFDDAGNIIRKDAVAESPITGRHGMFVFREDVAEGLPCQDVLALPKNYAKQLGARMVLHVKLPERTVIDLLTERARILLTCPKSEFYALEFRASTHRGYWVPRSIVRGPTDPDPTQS